MSGPVGGPLTQGPAGGGGIPLHMKDTSSPYPEIDDANFKGALWTFKQQWAWKMCVRCGISIVLLQTSLYCDFRDTPQINFGNFFFSSFF